MSTEARLNPTLDGKSRTGAYVSANMSLAVAVLMWGVAPVTIRYLSADYRPFTQAFLRYFFASATVVLLGLVFHRRALAAAARQWLPLLGVAAFNVAAMLCWTVACYHTTATLAQLISKLDIVFVTLLSYLFFHEERRIIRNPRFLCGAAMGLFGVATVLIKDPFSSLLPDFDMAALLLIVVAALWASYTVTAKHMVADLNPAALFAVVGVYTTVVLGIFALVFERPLTLAAPTPWITFVGIASGIGPIAIGHSAYHYAQKHLGAAYSSSLLLATPFVANAVGVMIWDDESMTWIQWMGAAILLGGSLLVIRVGIRARRIPPE